MNENNTIRIDMGFIPDEKINDLFTDKFMKLRLTILVIIAENKQVKDVNDLTCSLKEICEGKPFHIVFTSIVNFLFEMLSSDKMVEAMKILGELSHEEYNNYIR